VQRESVGAREQFIHAYTRRVAAFLNFLRQAAGIVVQHGHVEAAVGSSSTPGVLVASTPRTRVTRTPGFML
jgi:hypothetical protein